MESFQQHFRAPELFGEYWLNGEPVSVREMRGNVLLIDFWDYSSAHCIRALPYIKEWERKYRDYGLVVVGVHTPEFPFGQNEENVRRAVKEFGVTYTMVGDNDARIWSSFGCRSWPTKFLVDKDGFIRFAHQGPGSYDQFERAIQVLVTEAGMRGELPDLTAPFREADAPGAICYRTTGEIRAGYLRGALGNLEGYSPESTLEFTDPGMYLPGRFYLQGRWKSEKECARFVGGPKKEGSVTVRYEAAEVNSVLDPGQKRRTKVFVHQDGKWLTKGTRGKDITVGKDGSTFLVIDRPGMYHVIRNMQFGEHLVRLSTKSADLQLFSFSFATSVIPEVVNASTLGIGLN